MSIKNSIDFNKIKINLCNSKNRYTYNLVDKLSTRTTICVVNAI